jgi:hypothetical protein
MSWCARVFGTSQRCWCLHRHAHHLCRGRTAALPVEIIGLRALSVIHVGLSGKPVPAVIRVAPPRWPFRMRRHPPSLEVEAASWRDAGFPGLHPLLPMGRKGDGSDRGKRETCRPGMGGEAGSGGRRRPRSDYVWRGGQGAGADGGRMVCDGGDEMPPGGVERLDARAPTRCGRDARRGCSGSLPV